MTLTAAAAKTLADELAQLSRQQNDALEISPYLTMSKAAAEAYDRRNVRISQLWELLRNYWAK
jgi:hypothetical protein